MCLLARGLPAYVSSELLAHLSGGRQRLRVARDEAELVTLVENISADDVRAAPLYDEEEQEEERDARLRAIFFVREHVCTSPTQARRRLYLARLWGRVRPTPHGAAVALVVGVPHTPLVID